MKVPISENELGLVVPFGERFYFVRNGTQWFERDKNKYSIISWKEFKENYPIDTGEIWWRRKEKPIQNKSFFFQMNDVYFTEKEIHKILKDWYDLLKKHDIK